MREESAKIWSAVLSALVHLIFLALLVFAVHWQNHPPAAVEVGLWRSVPAAKPQPASPAKPKRAPPLPAKPKPAPPPKPAKPKPAAKPMPPKPAAPTKADIELRAKREKARREKQQQEKLAREQRAAQKRKRAALRQARAEKRKAAERQRRILAIQQQKQAEALRRQQALAAAAASRQATAQAKVVSAYRNKIESKIRPLINNQACLSLGQPTAIFRVTLMPTGDLLMEPKLVKTSGLAACDQAIERAIIRAQPLPLPPDRSLFDQFRVLRLSFRPNQRRGE